MIGFMEPVWYVLTKQPSTEITKLEVFLILQICKPYAHRSDGRFHNSSVGRFPILCPPELEFWLAFKVVYVNYILFEAARGSVLTDADLAKYRTMFFVFLFSFYIATQSLNGDSNCFLQK